MQLHTISIDNSGARQTGSAAPVLFLHGFGGLGKQWWGLQTSISYFAPTLAFDLPGHGNSLDFPDAGPPKVAARAVLAELDARGIEKAHFVGHSMGGAISSLAALLEPERIASLTLLAPGGYGPEFNHPLLLQWARARSREQLGEILPNFFGKDYVMHPKIIDFQFEARNQPGAVESLTAIAEAMSKDGKQGVLPVDDVLAGSYPISVVWGDDDQVLPVSQTEQLKDRVDLHIVKGAGHSPAEEATELVRTIIRQQIQRDT